MGWAEYKITVPDEGTGEVYTTCPECSPERKKNAAKCLSANLTDGIWFCHHCGWKGSLKSGTRALGSKPKYELPTEIQDYIPEEEGLRLLRERGITMSAIRRNKIVCAKVFMPQVGKEVGAVAFQYFRGDKLLNRKWRQLDEKNFRLESGSERLLYKSNDIAETTIITEGEMDCLALESAGHQNCVSVPDGAPAPNTKDYASKFSFLEAESGVLAKVKTFLIAVDNDGPGEKLSEELSRRLGRHRCKRVTWPQGCKDANDTLMRYGKEGIDEALDDARGYPVKGIHSILDLGSRVTPLYNRGLLRGLRTGWPSIDDHYTVRPGELTIVTGIPSHGKSTWMDNLMLNMVRMHDWRFLVFSPENLPLEHYTSRLLEKWVGRPFFDNPKLSAMVRMSAQQADQAMEDLNPYIQFIMDDEDTEMNVDWILATAREYLLSHGVRGLVIDPWNEIEHRRPSSLTETEYIGQSLSKIKRFARNNGIHVWIVAHPTKLEKEKNDTYPVPTMYNINGGANWFNKADNGICIWRDLQTLSPVTEVYIQKIRFKEVGVIGKKELNYSHLCGTYTDPAGTYTQGATP